MPGTPTDPGHGTSLYVHVPFCVVKCGYCDFNSYVVDDQRVHDRFVDVLLAELRREWRGGRPVSVFIGGGTPSLLAPHRLQRLLREIDAQVGLRGCAEVTMEANPESLTVEKASIALGAGVSRLSIGAQTFRAKHLAQLDRAHDAAAIEAAVTAAREAGFTNISLDLMFGIPGQTLDEWRQDLDRALSLDPDHLSCYNLTFEPGTRLYRDLQRGATSPNEQEVDRAMFLHTRERLASAGFDPYEISNFAGRGGPCRHNDHYWLQGDYVGVGPGAASHRAGVRATSLRPVEAWAQAVEDGLPAAASAETLSPAQRAGEAIWLGLRRSAGVDLERLERRLDTPVRERAAAAIRGQVAEQLVRWDGRTLRLTPAGLLLADRVGAAFLSPP